MDLKRIWEAHCLPGLIERACRSRSIFAERERWVPHAVGEVLELGIGSGLNLALFDPTRVTHLVGVDPSAALLERAASRARRCAFPVELRAARAERLAFDAGRFDCVLATFTLCSVDDLEAVLKEVRRVLRRDGKLVFVEHGAAPDAIVRAWQQRITPLWRHVSGNCHLDRDVPAALASAAYAIEELEAAHAEGGTRLTSFTTAGIARPG